MFFWTYSRLPRWTNYLRLLCCPLVARWRGFCITLKQPVDWLLLPITSISNMSWRAILKHKSLLLWSGRGRLLLLSHHHVATFLAECDVDHGCVWHAICSACWTAISYHKINDIQLMYNSNSYITPAFSKQSQKWTYARTIRDQQLTLHRHHSALCGHTLSALMDCRQ